MGKCLLALGYVFSTLFGPLLGCCAYCPIAASTSLTSKSETACVTGICPHCAPSHDPRSTGQKLEEPQDHQVSPGRHCPCKECPPQSLVESAFIPFVDSGDYLRSIQLQSADLAFDFVVAQIPVTPVSTAVQSQPFATKVRLLYIFHNLLC